MKWRFFESIGYKPSAAQRQIHESLARFLILAAGARFGKSMCAGAMIALYLLYPGSRIWCVAPIYELADREFTWVLEFLAAARTPSGSSLLTKARVSTAARGSRKISFPEIGSYCQTKSTEKPAGLFGEELDLLVLCEASQIAREPWERALRARIGPRRGRLIATSTPNGDSGLFNEFLDHGWSEDKNFSDWEAWRFSTIENPTFSRDEFEKARRELDPKVFAEQYEGKSVSRRGLVFDVNDAHKFDKMPDGWESWGVVACVKRGFQNPFAVVLLAIKPDDRSYWLFDEVYELGASVEAIAAKIAEKTKGLRLRATLMDYHDPVGISMMKKAGVACTCNDEKKFNRNSAIIKRIQALMNALRPRENGPRLRIKSTCKNTLYEMANCKWPDKRAEESDRAEPELPLDKYFSVPQALSYGITYLEMAARGVDVYGIQAKNLEVDRTEYANAR